MIHRIVGEFLLIGLVLSAIILGGSIGNFIDVPSLLLVFLGGTAMMFISFSLDDFRLAVDHVLGKPGTTTEYRKSAGFWRAAVVNYLLIGGIGTLLGLMQMLQSVQDMQTILPCTSIALITFFYSLFFVVICPLPSYFRIQRTIAMMQD